MHNIQSAANYLCNNYITSLCQTESSYIFSWRVYIVDYETLFSFYVLFYINVVLRDFLVCDILPFHFC